MDSNFSAAQIGVKQALTTEIKLPGPANPALTMFNGPTLWAIPAVVDHYRLLRTLGWGGTGIVIAAEDISLNRQVAIKLISHEMASGRTRRRILREARLANRVRHPHVISIYDTGTCASGVYVVMEMAEGGSVQSLLRDGALPWRVATAILVAACEGVMAVHGHGIVHCDIKPANLLRTADGRVKIGDFGLARRLGRSRNAAAIAQVSGTPHFMSPEQCRAEECDERTDIYALGATYHTLLTGSTPYTGATPVRLMFEHCSAPVPDPRIVHRGIPRACAEIVMRAMAKKRADRYDTAREFQNALRAVCLGRSKAWRT